MKRRGTMETNSNGHERGFQGIHRSLDPQKCGKTTGPAIRERDGKSECNHTTRSVNENIPIDANPWMASNAGQLGGEGGVHSVDVGAIHEQQQQFQQLLRPPHGKLQYLKWIP